MRFLWRVLLGVAILGVVASVGWNMFGGGLRERFDERVAALRAAGQPTRFEDLATTPVPDAENGAKLLEEAHAWLLARQRDSGDADDLLYEADRTPEENATLAAYLDSLAPYFDMLRRVPERPHFRPNLDWNAGFAMRVDLYPQLVEARRHVVARVEIDPASGGRTERAADAAALMLALSARCRGPFLVGYMISESMASDVEEILRIAMKRPGFDAAVFRRAVDPLLARSIAERGPPRRVFVEERAFMIGAIDAIRSGAPYRGNRSISFLKLPELYRDAGRILDVLEEAIARAETTPEDALAASRELRAGGMSDHRIFGDTPRVYARAFRAYTDGVADRRLARIVLALLQHKQKTGAWPESLEALGEMPTDPYSGQPFLYERLERGCRVRAASDQAIGDLEEDPLGWTLRDDQIPMSR